MRLPLLLVLALAAVPALAQQYKWVDANGQVQYSDAPPPGVKAEPVRARISAVPGGSGSGSAASGPRTVAEQEQAFRKRLAQAQENEKKEQVASQESAERKRACESARARSASLESGGRQVRMDGNGERHYLDDNEIAREKSEAQQDASKYCR